MAPGALSGLKVLEWGAIVSAPFSTKLMAELGAEVVKIEGPGIGDESRRYGPFPGDAAHPERSGLFLYLNTGKLGITLNLGTAKGKEVLRRLLKDTDVFVENQPYPLVRELGLEYEALREINPRLIVTSLTPFGQTGPYRDYKGHDINICGMGGLSIGIGYPDREPLTLPAFIASYQSGLAGTIATLLAVLARDVTGRGQHIDISETDVIATVHAGYYIPTFIYRGVPGKRHGRRGGLWGRYPSGVFTCKDGYVFIAAPQLEQWTRFLGILGDPEWATQPRYRDRRAMTEEYPDEVDALIAPWLMAHTREEVFTLCRQARVPCGPILSIEEAVNHPHLEERGYFEELNHPEVGGTKYPGSPFRFSKTPGKTERPAPLLGEHNEEIYCHRLGLSRDDMAQLRKDGII